MRCTRWHVTALVAAVAICGHLVLASTVVSAGGDASGSFSVLNTVNQLRARAKALDLPHMIAPYAARVGVSPQTLLLISAVVFAALVYLSSLLLWVSVCANRHHCFFHLLTPCRLHPSASGVRQCQVLIGR